MFSAPSSGLYVFTWTIYTGNHGQTGFYIYVNHEVLGATWGETDGVARDFDSDSGSMVVSLNANDNVYIRSARACSTYVVSDEGARTSFAGWRLNWNVTKHKRQIKYSSFSIKYIIILLLCIMLKN